MTYNHVGYIEDALQGFAKQDTSFPVVFIIIDDASTDGEQERLRIWVDENLDTSNAAMLWKEMPYGFIAEAPLKNKQNSVFVFILLKENHYQNGLKWKKFEYMAEWNNNAKYLATCEGDDYWTSEYKLQKQVDFLESHPDYSFCVHNFQKYIENNGNYLEGFRYKKDFSFDTRGYLEYWPTQPLTALTRAEATPSVDIRKRFKYYRDNHHYYLLLQKGMGYYMADVMGVYRVTNNGVWTSLNSVAKIEIDLKCYLELYHYNKADKDLRRKCISQYVLYLRTCKENSVAPKEDLKNEMGAMMTMLAKVLLFYSGIRRLMNNTH